MLLLSLFLILLIGFFVEFSLGAMKSRQIFVLLNVKTELLQLFNFKENTVFLKFKYRFYFFIEILLYFLIYYLCSGYLGLLVKELFIVCGLINSLSWEERGLDQLTFLEFFTNSEGLWVIITTTADFLSCLWATYQISKNKQGSLLNCMFLLLFLTFLLLIVGVIVVFSGNLEAQQYFYSLLTFSLSFTVLKVYSINHWLTYVGCFIILTIYLCLPLFTIVFLFFFRSSTYFVLVPQSLVMNLVSKAFIVMISSGLHYAGQYCGLPTASQLWAAISKFNLSSFYNQGVFNNIIWDSWFCQIKLSPTVTIVNEAFMKVHHDYYQYIRYLPDQQQMYTKLSAAVFKVELLEANQLLQELKQTVVPEVVPFVMTELQTTTTFGLLAFLLLGILLASSGHE